MLQVAVRRLRRKWPSALIQVLTNDPVALNRMCPDVEPLAHAGRTLWFSNRALFGRLHEHLPGAASRELLSLQGWMRRNFAGFYRSLLLRRMYLTGTDATALRAFLSALDNADLFLVSGAAAINDKAKAHARIILGTIEMALERHIPVTLCSQGIGPLLDRGLFEEVARVLPRVDRIHLRERLYGPALLSVLGVQSQKLSVTGDDAVELAYEVRSERYGEGMGINLRLGPSSDVDSAMIARLREILLTAAKLHNASLVPLPIAMHSASNDPLAIRQLLGDDASNSDEDSLPKEPRDVIAAVSGCRIVVTGAYHAAVFALAQGIPVVCLVGNVNYREKFNGLADQFGSGCQLVELLSARMSEELMSAIERAWNESIQIRQTLLTAARNQVQLGQSAYQRISELFNDATQTSYSALQPSSSHS